MKRMVLVAAAAALVAGCSGSENADADGNGEVSMAEAAKAAEAQGLKPEPGQYKTTVTMTEIAIPGMPPEMKGHGAGMARTIEYCVNEKDVEGGYEQMLKQGQNGECSFEKFSLAGGTINAVMVCQTPQGSTRMMMNGSATPTTSDYTASMTMNLDGAGEGTMTFTGRSERIGDCPAK